MDAPVEPRDSTADSDGGQRFAGRRIVAGVLDGLLCVVAASGLRSEPPRAPEPLVLEVEGNAFEWHVRYAGADARLGTPDDRQMTGAPRLPADTPVILRLTSGDYLYSFAVPALGINEVAIPERTYELRFRTPAATSLELRGDQFCGFSHPRLIGTIVVEPSSAFGAWLSRLPLAADEPPPTPDTNHAGTPRADRSVPL